MVSFTDLYAKFHSGPLRVALVRLGSLEPDEMVTVTNITVSQPGTYRVKALHDVIGELTLIAMMRDGWCHMYFEDDHDKYPYGMMLSSA